MGVSATLLKVIGLPLGKTELGEDLHGHYNQMSSITLSITLYLFIVYIYGKKIQLG